MRSSNILQLVEYAVPDHLHDFWTILASIQSESHSRGVGMSAHGAQARKDRGRDVGQSRHLSASSSAFSNARKCFT